MAVMHVRPFPPSPQLHMQLSSSRLLPRARVSRRDRRRVREPDAERNYLRASQRYHLARPLRTQPMRRALCARVAVRAAESGRMDSGRIDCGDSRGGSVGSGGVDGGGGADGGAGVDSGAGVGNRLRIGARRRARELLFINCEQLRASTPQKDRRLKTFAHLSSEKLNSGTLFLPRRPTRSSSPALGHREAFSTTLRDANVRYMVPFMMYLAHACVIWQSRAAAIPATAALPATATFPATATLSTIAARAQCAPRGPKPRLRSVPSARRACENASTGVAARSDRHDVRAALISAKIDRDRIQRP
eukprot:6190840-Pleurochrysis_carterae.AAC.1